MNRLLACLMLTSLGCSAAHRTVAAQPSGLAATARHREMLEEAAAPPVLLAPLPAARPVWEDPATTLASAVERAPPGPRRVLDATRAMLDQQTVVRGSCYTWTNAVYHRAGGHPRDVFHATRRAPYADASLLQPGDWVFFINHSFNNVTHSAIFVRWIDEAAREAVMVSYPGGNRDAPGRFGQYELTNVYRLVRMDDDPNGAPRNP